MNSNSSESGSSGSFEVTAKQGGGPRAPSADFGTSASASSSSSDLQPERYKPMDRDERIAYLEDMIKKKDAVLVILAEEIASASKKRDMLLEMEVLTIKEAERLKVIEEVDLPDMRERERRLVEEVAKHKTELSALRWHPKEVAEAPVPAQVRKNDPVAEFARLLSSKGLDAHVVSALYKRDTDVKALENGVMTIFEARNLLKILMHIVTTTAAKQFASRSGYIFDDLIIPISSQANTVLQYVIQDRLYCAKNGRHDTILRECNAMKLVHERHSICPTVLKVVDILEFTYCDVESSCLIIPYYPRSVAEVLGVEVELPDFFVIRAALCGLATIKAMDAIGYRHGDIKPSNMMVDNNSDVIVTIDFGVCTPYNERQPESSHYYPMDASTSSIEYDLTCLCSSILQLKNVVITSFSTKDELRATFSDIIRLPFVIAMLCLNRTSVDDIISEIIAIDGSYSAYIEKIMPRK